MGTARIPGTKVAVIPGDGVVFCQINSIALKKNTTKREL